MISMTKTGIKLTLMSLLLAPVFIFAAGAAVAQSPDAPVPTDNDTASPSREAEVQNQPALAERLAKRKAALKQRLTFAEQNRLKLGCRAAQGRLRSVEVRLNGIETRRHTAYENLTNRLTGLSEKLADKGIDVTVLNQQLTELQAKIADFDANLAEYKQAVADLTAMDCQADPEAFKASLEAARTARAETVQAARSVNQYLKETIKPTLQTIRSNLAETENE